MNPFHDNKGRFRFAAHGTWSAASRSAAPTTRVSAHGQGKALSWFHGGPTVKGAYLQPSKSTSTNNGIPERAVFSTTKVKLASGYKAKDGGKLYKVIPTGRSKVASSDWWYDAKHAKNGSLPAGRDA